MTTIHTDIKGWPEFWGMLPENIRKWFSSAQRRPDDLMDDFRKAYNSEVIRMLDFTVRDPDREYSMWMRPPVPNGEGVLIEVGLDYAATPTADETRSHEHIWRKIYRAGILVSRLGDKWTVTTSH